MISVSTLTWNPPMEKMYIISKMIFFARIFQNVHSIYHQLLRMIRVRAERRALFLVKLTQLIYDLLEKIHQLKK